MWEGRLPLRTVLQNFISHVDSIEASRDDNGGDIYDREFQVRQIERGDENDGESKWLVAGGCGGDKWLVAGHIS